MRRVTTGPLALAALALTLAGTGCGRGAGDAGQGGRETGRAEVKDTTTLTANAGANTANAAAASTLGKIDAADNEEVQAGQLAQRDAQSNDVKRLGYMLAQDHMANRKQVEQVAKAVGVTPTPPPDAAARQMTALDQLTAKKGADFDRAFVQMQIDDHQQNIDALKAARATADPKVQALIDSTLPTLEKHLAAAQAAQKKVGGAPTQKAGDKGGEMTGTGRKPAGS